MTQTRAPETRATEKRPPITPDARRPTTAGRRIVHSHWAFPQTAKAAVAS